jgi:hypothetical protein
MKGDVDKLDAVNANLLAQRAAAAASAVAPRNPTIGMSRGQQQRAILNNLRQISAARDQYILEHGRPPGSVHELIGETAYIKMVRTVGGEDYSQLSMSADQPPMTVVALDGTTVTYDPVGGTSTRPELSEREQRVEDRGRQLEPKMRQAEEAYRAAHNGKKPPNEQAVAPFFATPQDAAEFMEYVKERRAVGM